MKKIKVSEATGTTLDWLVAKCEDKVLHEKYRAYKGLLIKGMWGAIRYKPSTDWSQGGPIIEREGGTLWSTNADGWRYKACYDFANDKEGAVMHGPTPLIAAMRCYVASKLGDEVEVPEELT